jgi:phosphatidylglycerol:prolipoprotein diacylglycerol transferase
MLPFYEQPVLHLGPIPIYAFGVLVACAIGVGIYLATKRAPGYGIDKEALYDFVQWVLIPGFLGAHILDAVWYHPAEVLEDPAALLLTLGGLSSFGGFLGAVTGAFLYGRRHQVAILPYVDLCVSVFPVAWIFGRAGCTVAHDHPGLHTTADNPLAFAYPDGARWDLGFLEMLFSVLISIGLYFLWKKPRTPGFYVAYACMTYAPIRFALDYLRAEADDGGDARYASLTPGQWAAIAMFATGAYFAWRINQPSNGAPALATEAHREPPAAA